MPIKHSTIPPGIDQPGFNGVTPSIWAQQHTFSGGTQGAVLVYNTGNSDNSAWVSTIAGVLTSSAVNAIPVFSATLSPLLGGLGFAANGIVKGGILSGTGAGTIGITTVGTDGQLLTADAASVGGVKWNTPAAIPPAAAGTLTGTTLAAGVTLSSLTTLGTIVTGVWNGTKIGLAFGGTNVDLSATGGANQILKQNSAGANITVGTIAVTNLSDGTNVALLNAANVFTADQTLSQHAGNKIVVIGGSPAGDAGSILQLIGSNAKTNWQISQNGAGTGLLEITPSSVAGGSTFPTPMMTISGSGVVSVLGFGGHSWNASGVGANYVQVGNTAAGTSNYGMLAVRSDTTNFYARVQSSTFTTTGIYLQSGATLEGDGAGGLSIGATHGSGAIRFYSGGGAIRWGINTAGDSTVGTSNHILDSVGVPTVSSGFGTGPSIAGNDYAFIVTTGSTSSSSGVVNFGHTFASQPVCVTSLQSGAGSFIVGADTTTTNVSITVSGSIISGSRIYVQCRGY